MRKFILATMVLGLTNSEAMLTNCMKNFSSNAGVITLQTFGKSFAQAATQNQSPTKNDETSPVDKVLPKPNNENQNVQKLIVTLDPKYDPLIKRFWLLTESSVRANVYSAQHLPDEFYYDFVSPYLGGYPEEALNNKDWLQDVMDIFSQTK